jgi:hypothetical protein
MVASPYAMRGGLPLLLVFVTLLVCSTNAQDTLVCDTGTTDTTCVLNFDLAGENGLTADTASPAYNAMRQVAIASGNTFGNTHVGYAPLLEKRKRLPLSAHALVSFSSLRVISASFSSSRKDPLRVGQPRHQRLVFWTICRRARRLCLHVWG